MLQSPLKVKKKITLVFSFKNIKLQFQKAGMLFKDRDQPGNTVRAFRAGQRLANTYWLQNYNVKMKFLYIPL